MNRQEENEPPVLAVAVQYAGRVFDPPLSEHLMRKLARDGAFPTFEVPGSSGRPGRKRQFVRVSSLEDYMRKLETL